MNNVLKQVMGIDVAQAELVTHLGKIGGDLSPILYASATFPNTQKGFVALVKWVDKLTDKEVPVCYVMEATGVYHEPLAYWLDEQGCQVSIVLPTKISNYHRTLATKTITDKTSSQTITLFGLQHKVDRWHRPKRLLKQLRQLTRERNQLIAERTVLKNQLHAEASEAEPNKKSVKRIKGRIALLQKQEKEIIQEIRALIATDKEMQTLVLLLCTLPGIGLLTAATVLGETGGFELIRNKRQLASYAGLDVKEKQSGTSVKGKPQISKKGNRMLRKAMHLPALTAIRRDERFKAIFVRLVAKHGIKMKAVVAIQRKLLEMVFTIFKTGKSYDKNYLQKQNGACQTKAVKEKLGDCPAGNPTKQAGITAA